MPPNNITVLEEIEIKGGSIDGVGNLEDGDIVRRRQVMNWNSDTLWDMFHAL